MGLGQRIQTEQTAQTEQTERDRSQDEVRDQFVNLIRTEHKTMLIASTFLATIGVVMWVPGLLYIVAFGVASGTMRQLASIPASKGRMQLAVAVFAGGIWATTIFIVTLLPIALPVMMFNVVVPVVLAATYLDDREHWPIAVAGVAVAGIIGVLGLTQDGMRMQDGVSEGIVDWAIIGFLVGYTWMFTATVRDANRTRVATLERALAANEGLVEAQQELRLSRRRLLDVADQERGRIERNIHDGAQQRLVSMAVQLRLASQLADQGQVPTVETLNLLHDEATLALSDLRELAQGIYPSLLADRGLVDAVRSVCRRSPLPASVAGVVEGEIPEDVQAAVYFFCAEAVQNANKHAGSEAELTIEFSQADKLLMVTVTDSGVGFDVDDVSDSRGMLNMSDRIAAVDGSLSITSSPGGEDGVGTTLRTVVPVSWLEPIDNDGAVL